MEMVPAARRMAVLADANTAAPQNMRMLQEAAGVRGVELAVRLVERPERIVPEIEEARRAGAEALNVLASPILARRLDIFERTAALRLPAMYQSPEFAEEGGLIGYGPRITLMFRQLARQLAKVFLPARTCCTWLCARAQFCSCPAMGGRKRRAAIRACQVRWRFLIRRYVGLFLALLGPLVFLSGFWGFL